jgi:two-component system, NtrC family, response regulator AtoC
VPTKSPDELATRPSDASAADGLHLVVLGDGVLTQMRLPDKGQLRIGRTEEADVRIDRESVSRRHAVLHIGPPLELEDLGSSNGTRVAGMKLAPHVRTQIVPGDVIAIGEVTLLVQGQSATAKLGAAVRVGGTTNVADAEVMERIAKSGINVLVLGETGAGKEVTARRIHGDSQRAAGPFIAINCAAVPDALLESELFGHEAGAFTGARAAKPGLLETAGGGTLFLDEVGDLPAAAQVKLLRVLEDRRLTRLGAITSRELDVRFISATHRDLRTAVANGSFREDLYYRLSGITLAIPPLRERLAELASLVELFVTQAAERVGRKPPSVEPATLARLRGHAWPGNIRELRNVVERAVVLCGGDVLTPEHVVIEAITPRIPGEHQDDETARILAALQACAGNQTRAAEQLGMARKTLGLRMDALGIPRPKKLHGD